MHICNEVKELVELSQCPWNKKKKKFRFWPVADAFCDNSTGNDFYKSLFASLDNKTLKKGAYSDIKRKESAPFVKG